MIDTIFFILVFFVVASVSMVHQRGLRVDLPQAAMGTRPDQARVDVTVTADGLIYLDKEPIGRDELRDRLHQVLAGSPETLVVLNADGRAEHRCVIDVMDQARRAGARALTIAVRPGDED
jgi:biopolymer transport protein ExbD